MKITPESLRKIRKEYGISQMTLGMKTGVGRFNVSLFENCQRELKDDEYDNIEKYLKEVKSGSKNKKG